MRRSLVFATISIAAFTTFLPGQEGEVGLKQGQYLPKSFQVYPATGEHAGRKHCLVCQHGLNPAVMVFTREIPHPKKPLGKLLKRVDQVIAKYTAVKTGAFVVVLSDDTKDYMARQKLAVKVADAAKALDTPNVVYSLDTADGPEGYSLDKANSEVVVFYHKQKVLLNQTYGEGGVTAGNEEKIAAEVEKTVAELEKQVRPGRPRRAKETKETKETKG